MDQHRHAPPERSAGKALWRRLEEPAAGQRQRSDEAVAERIMEHGRASPGGMEADLLLGLEDDNARPRRQLRRDRQAGDPAADDQDVGASRHRQAAVSRSWTTLPPCVRRIPRTISSSSGSTTRPCSLSQKALRKLYRLRANSADESAASVRARLDAPMMVTPCFSTRWSATVPSTLPPALAARSTMTLPGRMLATCASLMRRGAGLPGISAVVMTMSCFAIWPETSSACAF